MNLSKRLYALASLVDSGANVFDIGCDHGLLAIYLSFNNHKVVATDISIDSVNKAKENIKKYNASNIEVKNIDGLTGLNIKKSDNIIIAGMGTNTILKILNDNKSILSNTLIIQTNKNHDILRREVCKLGYYIEDEKIIVEDYLYVIIKFKKGYKKYKDTFYIIGLSNDKIYLSKLLERYKKLYISIPKKYIYKRFRCFKIIRIIQKRINQG